MMEKINNTVDDRKLVIGEVKPEVKAFDNLARDLFARVGGDIGVGFEQRLVTVT